MFCAVGYYSAVKMKYAICRKMANLEMIVLNEVSQTKTSIR